MSENVIPTQIQNFEELISKDLIIPSYQRPYTWDYKNIDNMVDDFNEFLINTPDQKYYMGAILLHNEKDKFYIVDGQQRITSLILLAIVLEIEKYNIDMQYENLQTKKQIKANYNYIKNKSEKIQNISNIFEKICFTVIITNNIDDAFTFFDTQNSRGVQPNVLVLLKAFNLRCINSKNIQKTCANEWDNHERHEDYHLAEKSDKLEWLIKIFFYRVRNWRGNRKANFGNYEEFRDSFTKKIRKSNHQEYQLFVSMKNKKIIYEEYEHQVKAKNIDWFDFLIRQPIYQGEGFFKFLNHYSQLLDELMKVEIYNGENFEALLKVHKSGSVYMESFLTMVTLVYFDRFGKEGLNKFVKIINDILVDIRLSSTRILKQTLEINFIRCQNNCINQNILDFICSAFDSQEVIEWFSKPKQKIVENISGVRKVFNDKNQNFWGNNNE